MGLWLWIMQEIYINTYIMAADELDCGAIGNHVMEYADQLDKHLLSTRNDKNHPIHLKVDHWSSGENPNT